METTTINSSRNTIWLSSDIELDLREQGHLEGPLAICATRINDDTYGGVYRGIHFLVSWQCNTSLILSMEEYNEVLVDAFAVVLGYPAFCKYRLEMESKIFYVAEWNKVDTMKRILYIKGTPEIKDIEILSPTKL
jgi:hypothetical protein